MGDRVPTTEVCTYPGQHTPDYGRFFEENPLSVKITYPGQISTDKNGTDGDLNLRIVYLSRTTLTLIQVVFLKNRSLSVRTTYPGRGPTDKEGVKKDIYQK